MTKALQAEYRALRIKQGKIEDELDALTRKAFPVGHATMLMKWGGNFTVCVIDHAGSRVRVRRASGKEYWVDSYWLWDSN